MQVKEFFGVEESIDSTIQSHFSSCKNEQLNLISKHEHNYS